MCVHDMNFAEMKEKFTSIVLFIVDIAIGDNRKIVNRISQLIPKGYILHLFTIWLYDYMNLMDLV